MNHDIMPAEWRWSTRSLQVADLLSWEDYRESTVSRFDYAILHTAETTVLVQDVMAANHADDWQMFEKHFICTGYTEGQCSKHLARNFDDYLMINYDVRISLHLQEIPTRMLLGMRVYRTGPTIYFSQRPDRFRISNRNTTMIEMATTIDGEVT